MSRQIKKQTVKERLELLERIVVKQSMQIEGLINAITKAQNKDVLK